MASPADRGCDCGYPVGYGHSHGHGMAFRCFVSKQETKEKLEQYEDQLKKEFAGVRERIQELQGS
jgi:hypothetical protein